MEWKVSWVHCSFAAYVGALGLRILCQHYFEQLLNHGIMLAWYGIYSKKRMWSTCIPWTQLEYANGTEFINLYYVVWRPLKHWYQFGAGYQLASWMYWGHLCQQILVGACQCFWLFMFWLLQYNIMLFGKSLKHFCCKNEALASATATRIVITMATVVQISSGLTTTPNLF